MNEGVVRANARPPIDGLPHGNEGILRVLQPPCSAVGVDGGPEDRLDPRAGEDTVRAGARARGHELEEGGEVVEAIRDSEGPDHPLEGGVVVAEGVELGCPVKDVEVVEGEVGVMVELRLEEVEEGGGREGDAEVGGEEGR